MEFRILGPLQVLVGDHPVEVAGPKQRTLLAALVLHSGRVVSKDRLFEILWGPQPPDGAGGTLQSHMSHLREVLEPGRGAGEASVLRAREPGYLLTADPEHSIDAARFERLAGEGRRALAERAPAVAAERLELALGLWRGEPLAEFTFAAFAQGEIARLGELRLATLEDRFEADLALGRHAEVAGDLRSLVREEPLRERLWGQLMLALYRAGRQAEALRAYAEVREVLGEQLGIDPSPALARLERAILQQEPGLEWVPGPDVERRAPRWETPESAGRPVPAPSVSGRGQAEAGLAAFGRRQWEQAFQSLTAADQADVLTPAELEALAEAAFWTGRSGRCIEVCERMHRLHLDAGNRRKAAHAALLVCLQHAIRLRTAVAAGWFALASQLLEDEPDCVERGYLAWAMATVLVVLGTPDPAPAMENASQVLDCGRRFVDADLRAVGLTYRGYVLVHQGEPADGLPLLDEAMANAAAGALGPLATAAVVCRTLSTCVGLHDYGRAAEWLTAMERCATEHGMAGFPGDCRMHHAQVLLARGAWSEAERQARRACAEMDDYVREHAGLAFFTVGEVLRLTGDLDGAEEAFGRADELGRTPQPGLALALLARGDAPGALCSLRRALDADPWNRLARARHLTALVEVCAAVGDTAGAGHAAAELEEVAAVFSSVGLRAAADQARGAVALLADRPDAAVEVSYRSWQGWRRIGASYDAARARMQLGLARRASGDTPEGTLDLRAAQACFERLGARPDAERAAAALVGRPTGSAVLPGA